MTRCAFCNEPLSESHAKTCKFCGHRLSAKATNLTNAFSMPQMRYPDAYVWLVLVSTLDIVLTFIVMYVWRGREINPIAAAVIARMGFVWAIVFKYALAILVIIICEEIGRRHDRDGRTLSVGAVVISGIPVVYTFWLLLRAGPMPM